MQVLRGHSGRIDQAWTDGLQAVSASQEGEVRVWGVRSGVCTSILRRAPFLGRDGLPRGVGHSDSELEKVTALRVLRQVASPCQ